MQFPLTFIKLFLQTVATKNDKNVYEGKDKWRFYKQRRTDWKITYIYDRLGSKLDASLLQ